MRTIHLCGTKSLFQFVVIPTTNKKVTEENKVHKMVCVPCVAVPILLIIWRFLIQPLILKWWQFRNKIKCTKENDQPPDLVKDCKNGVCTLAWKKTNKDAVKSD